MVGSAHDAEDVLQEAFLRALQASDKYRGGDARAWVLTIVRNSARNFLRNRASREEAWTEKVPEPHDGSPGVETRLIEGARREALRAAIARLPDDFRETLVLREMEGLSYKEIAGVLDVPLGTVMSRLSRARALLLADLSEGGMRKGAA